MKADRSNEDRLKEEKTAILLELIILCEKSNSLRKSMLELIEEKIKLNNSQSDLRLDIMYLKDKIFGLSNNKSKLIEKEKSEIEARRRAEESRNIEEVILAYTRTLEMAQRTLFT
ncbi:MAG: hypothetical protein LBT59_28000 [Clostridiales bacterium]|nr:hypothetical protein [Clostridiales bacterium]